MIGVTRVHPGFRITVGEDVIIVILFIEHRCDRPIYYIFTSCCDAFNSERRISTVLLGTPAYQQLTSRLNKEIIQARTIRRLCDARFTLPYLKSPTPPLMERIKILFKYYLLWLWHMICWRRRSRGGSRPHTHVMTALTRVQNGL